jgi:2-dehydro-3-deoxygluconokinase
MPFDVLTLGEAMVLFAAEEAGPLAQVERFRRYSAGAELNVAIGLARLGLRVGYLSRLGADSFGRFLLDTMTANGVSTALVSSCEGQRTGFMLKGRTVDGSDPEVEYHRRGSAASGMGRGDLARLGAVRARHLHLTAFRRRCLPVVANWFEPRAGRAATGCRLVRSEPPPGLWPCADEMTSTVNELASVVRPGAAGTRGRAAPDRPGGRRGDCRPLHRMRRFAGGREARRPRRLVRRPRRHTRARAGVPVPRVVDTVGAGDGFAVGVISGLLEGLGLPDAAMRGNRIALASSSFRATATACRCAELDEALPCP